VLNGWEPKESPEETVTEDSAAIAAATAADEDAPLDEGTTSSTETGSVEDAAAEFPPLEVESGEGWVKGDGENNVPDGFPIKGNADSMIYHPEESRFYDNTVAEFYFATPEVAESFGFRAPKGIKKAGSKVGDALKDAADNA
jgi:large subunit ribosomal protein L17